MDKDAEVGNWAERLTVLHSRIGLRFAHSEQRGQALGCLQAPVSPCERKNGRHLAEMVGESSPDGMQRLLNQALWDADAVRDDLRAYVAEHQHLGSEQAVPEVRRMLRLPRLAYSQPWEPEAVWRWPGWGRRHQARAKRCHYKRRQAITNE